MILAMNCMFSWKPWRAISPELLTSHGNWLIILSPFLVAVAGMHTCRPKAGLLWLPLTVLFVKYLLPRSHQQLSRPLLLRLINARP